MSTKATVIPCLRYRNAPAAIEWLCQAFGFEKRLVVPGEDETIAHAQLSFGNGMIHAQKSVKESKLDRLMKQPDEIGGAETQSANTRRRNSLRSTPPASCPPLWMATLEYSRVRRSRLLVTRHREDQLAEVCRIRARYGVPDSAERAPRD